MRIAAFTSLLSDLSLSQALAKLRDLGISSVELGTGNYPGDAHCPLTLLDDDLAREDFQRTLAEYGANICALSCHGNALHPDPARANAAREVSRKTILLAEKLGVSTVVDFSGCPGGSPSDATPNWITCAWPPDYQQMLAWQWEHAVAPYWREHAQFAAGHGVRIAIEMHPGFVVYSPETLLRLRQITGPAVGANLDPSHLFWQHIDPIAAIRVLGDAIHHVHAKDTQLYPANLPRTGVLDTQPYTAERTRGWLFRTVGYGHGAEWWKEFVSTLRMYGYDGPLSIEHEDSLLSAEEGLTKATQFLREILLREQPGQAWWV
jgi:sugar phosphate isomerase/epimerase